MMTKFFQAKKNLIAGALLLLCCMLTSCTAGAVTVIPTPGFPQQTPGAPDGDIPVEGVSMNLSHTTMTVGDAALLVATVSPLNASNQQLFWKSSDETVAKVNARGRVTALARGSAVITAETAQGGFAASCSVFVKATEHHTEVDSSIHVESVRISEEYLSLQVGDEKLLTASVLPDNAGNTKIQWLNSNSRTILLEETEEGAKITVVGTGRAVVTAISEDGGKSAACEIVVLARLQKLSLSSDAISMPTGGMVQLSAITEPAEVPNLTLTYSSSNPSIVSVDSKGLVTALAPGSATVSVSGGGHRADCTVTVGSKIPGTLAALSVKQNSLSLLPGESMTLFTTRAPASASDALTYRSADPSVAFVSPEGIVTGIHGGETTVTVSARDGTVRKSCTVTVEEEVAPYRIYLSKADLTMTAGETVTLVTGLSGHIEEGEEILFVSSDPSVATVDENGKVSAVAGGGVKISAVLSKSGYTAFCNVIVENIPVQSVSLSAIGLNMKKGETKQLQANIVPANASVRTVTFFSGDLSVATVNEQGVVTAVAPGETVITVQTLDGKKTARCTVKVTP